MNAETMAPPRLLTGLAGSPPLLADDETYVRLPKWLLVLFGAAAAGGLLTANPLHTAAAIALVPLFVSLLWRRGEPPVLLFILAYQWVQVTVKVFHADFYGLPIEALAYHAPGTIGMAIWLGMIGLVVLAVGMRLALTWLGSTTGDLAAEEAAEVPVGAALRFYLWAALFSTIANVFGSIVSSLAQPAGAIENIRWVAFFVLGYVVLKRREKMGAFLAVVAFEFISGVGFFSTFKTPLFLTLIIGFTVVYRLRPRAAALGLALVAVLLVMGSAWSAVKGDYRQTLTRGAETQSIEVGAAAQYALLVQQLGQLTWNDIMEGFEGLLERLSYVDFFAVSLDYVPAMRSHEGGALWGAALSHALMPRVFFPDKAEARSDSELTMEYTGLKMAGEEEGVSISLGYMGESYVDFGQVGMFGPVLALGLALGLMYVYFLKRAQSCLIGYAFATVVLFGIYAFEMATIKLVGGVLVQFVVLAAVLPIAEPWMRRRLSEGRPADGEPSRYGGPPDALGLFGPAPSAAGPSVPRPFGPRLGPSVQ